MTVAVSAPKTKSRSSIHFASTELIQWFWSPTMSQLSATKEFSCKFQTSLNFRWSTWKFSLCIFISICVQKDSIISLQTRYRFKTVFYRPLQLKAVIFWGRSDVFIEQLITVFACNVFGTRCSSCSIRRNIWTVTSPKLDVWYRFWQAVHSSRGCHVCAFLENFVVKILTGSCGRPHSARSLKKESLNHSLMRGQAILATGIIVSLHIYFNAFKKSTWCFFSR